MRIIVVTKSLNAKGGVANFYRELDRVASDNQDFVYVESGTSVKHYYRSNFIKGFFYPFNLVRTAYKLFKLNGDKFILNPSTTYVCVVRDLMLAFFLKILNRRVVVFFRGWRDEMFEKRAFRFLVGLLIKFSDGQVVLADVFKKKLQHIFKSARIRVVYTGVPRSLITNNQSVPKEKVILFMSRVSFDKGIHTFLDSILGVESLLVQQGYSVVVAGHFKDKLVSEYFSKALANFTQLDIRYVGFLEGKDRNQLLTKSEILILPSRFEGCPNIVVEALVYKCHVFASNVGAIPEIFANTTHGHLLKENTSEVIITELKDFLENSNRFVKPALNANFDKKFALESILNQLVKL